MSPLCRIVSIWWCWILCTDWLLKSQMHGYENLALNRLTWQQHPWLDTNKDVGSENAVDGLYFDRGTGGQCAISADNKLTSEWRVDLGNVASISHVDIFYRTDNQPSPTAYTSRMAGFFLYISNTTFKEDGFLCFHEIQNKTGTPLEDQSIKCPVHGRYVIYYNERRLDVEYPGFYSKFAYIELCEVKVYGCRSSGYFGDQCTLSCPTNCKEDRCHINTGYCFECLPGFKGQSCNEVCNNMTYGSNCASSCGNCSKGETCHFVDGSCPHGCAEGATGDKCQNSCPLGYYGKNCLNQCSKNCHFTRRCDRVTGQCDGGCKPGWDSITCDQKCGDGFFGKNCGKECGHCLKMEDCHHFNGTCLTGCLPGFNGYLCKEICPSGSFGLDCSYKCNSYCKGNESCDPSTGICYEGCKEGWSGLKCGIENESSGMIGIVVGIVSAIAINTVIIGFIIFIQRRGCVTSRNLNLRKSMDNSEPKQSGKKKETVEQYTDTKEIRESNTYVELDEIFRTGKIQFSKEM